MRFRIIKHSVNPIFRTTVTNCLCRTDLERGCLSSVCLSCSDDLPSERGPVTYQSHCRRGPSFLRWILISARLLLQAVIRRLVLLLVESLKHSVPLRPLWSRLLLRAVAARELCDRRVLKRIV